MKKYIAKPPTAGEFGPETICDQNYENFKHVHFLVDHFPEDLISRFPVYLVSEKLCDTLRKSNITGYELRPCKISCSEEYLDSPDNSLCFPIYYHIIFLEGNAERDFEIIDFELVVTEKVKKIIESLSCESTTFLAIS